MRGAERELRNSIAELNQDQMINELAPKQVEWHWNPPAGPHFGGAWERLIRSVKVALSAALKERSPREEVLLTVMAEAEAAVNSRPLTHVSVDPRDEDCLTPSHFLIGTPNVSLPPGEFTLRDLSARKQWRIAEGLADHFWQRWVREYMPTLLRRTKWNCQETTKPIEVGAVVVIVDPSMPRSCWPKGRVSAVFPGRDGQVRVVNVKTQFGEYRRPVSKICILDVSPE